MNLTSLKQKKIEIDKELKSNKEIAINGEILKSSVVHVLWKNSEDEKYLNKIYHRITLLKAQSQAYADGISACEEVLNNIQKELDRALIHNADKKIARLNIDKLKGEPK